MGNHKSTRYRDAGVNIDEAERAVSGIKKLARRTFSEDVLTDIGSFGAGYLLEGWSKPVLISSADGVGTKLKVAFLCGKNDTVGEDLVNHCVNDIAVQGAKPLFFLDYFATGKLRAGTTEEVIAGIARGCRNNGCALIGGETAEMPGLYAKGEYDLAGFIVGVVERKKMLTGESIREGDVLLGLPSSGLHTNGYSLARKLLFERAQYRVSSRIPELGCSVGDELLKVHRSYYGAIFALSSTGLLKGAAHITGGGITDNTPRILPKGLAAEIDTKAWPVLPIFELLRSIGRIPVDDYRRTFNLGLGMILAVSSRNVARAEAVLHLLGEHYYRVGRVVKASRTARSRVIYQ